MRSNDTVTIAATSRPRTVQIARAEKGRAKELMNSMDAPGSDDVAFLRTLDPIFENSQVGLDEKIKEISDRYIELYENITGKTFEKSDTSNLEGRIQKNVTEYLANL